MQEASISHSKNETLLMKFDPLLQPDSPTGVRELEKAFQNNNALSRDRENTLHQTNVTNKKGYHRISISLGSADWKQSAPENGFIDFGNKKISSAFQVWKVGNKAIASKGHVADSPQNCERSTGSEVFKVMGTTSGMKSFSDTTNSESSPETLLNRKPRLLLHRHSSIGKQQQNNISPCPPTLVPGLLLLPLMAKPSPVSFLTGLHDAEMRTSELQPAPFQLDIPSLQNFLIHSKLCNFLDTYRSQSSVSLSCLVGQSSHSLQMLVAGELDESKSWHTDIYRNIVRSLLAIEPNLTLEGYVATEQAEVAIVGIPKLSQIVVVIRGTDDLQSKPVRSKELKLCCPVAKTMTTAAAAEGESDIMKGNELSLHAPFWDAYSQLESGISIMLDRQSDKNPFANVVFTGASFGAALATLGAVRYASHRPTVLVSAHTFGSPRVGGIGWKHWPHSLPNLKVIRVERGDDSWVQMPVGRAFEHVGHSIVLHGSSSNSHSTNGKSNMSLIMATAYRFDKNKPSCSKSATTKLFRPMERSSKVYCDTLEICLKHKVWVTSFNGENVGDGISGNDSEMRVMV